MHQAVNKPALKSALVQLADCPLQGDSFLGNDEDAKAACSIHCLCEDCTFRVRSTSLDVAKRHCNVSNIANIVFAVECHWFTRAVMVHYSSSGSIDLAASACRL